MPYRTGSRGELHLDLRSGGPARRRQIGWGFLPCANASGAPPAAVGRLPEAVDSQPPAVDRLPAGVERAPEAVRRPPPEVEHAPPEVRSPPEEVEHAPPEVRCPPEEVEHAPPEVHFPPAVEGAPPSLERADLVRGARQAGTDCSGAPRNAGKDAGAPRPYVCSTPVLNSGTCGFIAAQARERPITCRVAAGSMRASTHRRAAA